jgi:hypothetical protein
LNGFYLYPAFVKRVDYDQHLTAGLFLPQSDIATHSFFANKMMFSPSHVDFGTSEGEIA